MIFICVTATKGKKLYWDLNSILGITFLGTDITVIILEPFGKHPSFFISTVRVLALPTIRADYFLHRRRRKCTVAISKMRLKMLHSMALPTLSLAEAQMKETKTVFVY